MKIGVFIARFQPIHKSHELIIHQALSENDQVYVFISCSDQSRQKQNPFTIEERIDMINQVFPPAIFQDRLIVVPLAEFPSYSKKKWGQYLYNKITETIKQNSFSLYCPNNTEMKMNWFTEEQKQYINFRTVERNKNFSNISATKIREALLNDDKNYLAKNLPCELYNSTSKFKKILSTV